MNGSDYDGRTSLHVAAAEGHFEVVKFLLDVIQVNPEPQDRWGFTPHQEAVRFGHTMVCTISGINSGSWKMSRVSEVHS